MPPAALQARPATGLIDLTIAIVTRRYWDFFVAELIPASPFLLVAVFVSSASIRYVQLASSLAGVVGAGTAAWLVSQEFTGRDVPLGDAVRRTMPRCLGLIGIVIVVGFTTGIGLLGVIVGAFVVLASMYAAIPAYLLEDVDVGSAIDRSMFLARGNMVHVLGVCVPVVLGLTTCNLAVSALIRLTWGAVTPHVHIPVRVETLSVMVAGLAIRPFAHVSQAVVYYDLRVRREGLDIEAMAAALDASAAPNEQPNAQANAPEANPA